MRPYLLPFSRMGIRYVFRGPGIRSALKDDDLTGMNVRRDRFRRGDDVAHVRLAVFVERRGDADDNGVHVGDLGVLIGRLEALARAPLISSSA